MMPGRFVVFTNATDQFITPSAAFEQTCIASDGTIYIRKLPAPDPEPVILNRAAERRYQRTGKVDYKPRRPEPWQRRR